MCRARSSSSCDAALARLAGPAAEVAAVVLDRELGDHRAPTPGAAPGALDELDEDHLGRVAAARAELQDAGVAAGTLGVAGGELDEQLVDGELVLGERRERLAAGVQIAALGERDQFLDLRADGLGLRLGGLDALVIDQLLD